MPRLSAAHVAAMTTLVLAALAAPVAADMGAPDCAGYVWYDNGSGCSPAVPPFGAGAVVVPDETDVVGPVPLGFVLPWYGRPVSEVWIAFDGYVTFSDQGRATTRTTVLPTGGAPNDMIAAYWSNMAQSATITYEATPEYFHVQWLLDVDGASPLTDVHLFLERTGTARIAWAQTDASFNFLLPTIGHESPDGSCGRTLFREGVSESGLPGTTFPEPNPGRTACIEPPAFLSCSGAIPLPCNASLPGTLPASLPEQAAIYGCSSDVFLGNERVYWLSIPQAQAATISINNPGLDLLFIPTGCDEGNCIAVASGGAPLDLSVLLPGDYHVVVDKRAAGGGDSFTISMTCSSPYEPIDCGQTSSATTVGRSSVFENHSCSPVQLDGPEALYVVNLLAADTLTATLRNASPDQWVVIYERAEFETGAGNCLAAGKGGAGLFDAPPGQYVIVVDGAAGAESSFELAVECGRRLTCDGTPAISCSQTISGDTSTSPREVSVYNCSVQALTGGEDVYRFFNPIEQTITASFITSQPGQQLLLLPTCDEGDCFLSGDSDLSCALFPPGEYLLVVDGVDGNDGPYSFDILCSEFLSGIDLRVTSIDASQLAGDCDTFDLAGNAALAISNIGRTDAPAGVEVVVFEDGIINAQFDDPGDQVLGRFTVANPIPAGETVFIDVPSSGTLLFRDNVIYAMVDPDDMIPESVETNNLFDTGRACEYRPPVGIFNPEVEWEWTGSTVLPAFVYVDTVPLVADMNGDGIPDVIFNAGDRAGGFGDGVVRVLDGATGGEIWTATAAGSHVWASSNLAVGDIDLDGRPEVVGQQVIIDPATGGASPADVLVALDSDGTFMWQSAAMVGLPAVTTRRGGGGPSIADLNCDGSPEIVWGNNVLNADGSLFWTPAPGGTVGRNAGSFDAEGPLSVAVDVDGDGVLEVVAGPTAYSIDGSILWRNTEVPDGFPAVGNFDGDDAPEIAITANGTMYLLEGDTGALIWQREIPRGGGGCTATNLDGGPPTVADFDGDCAAEVGVAGADYYVVFETNGTVKWQSPINDCSSHRTASSVFDFDGDGAAEVAFMDETWLHVFRGIDGTEIVTRPTSSHTWQEMIAIADVDADNNAEIIMPLNRNRTGIQVFGDIDDNWVNTRRIWNQHQYHINQVNDDGTIPGPADGCEEPSWRKHNTYRDQIGSAAYTAADLTISITDRRIILNNDCFRELAIVARIGNAGGINVGTDSVVTFFDEDPFQGGTILYQEVISDLQPGEYIDVQFTVPFPRVGVSNIHAFADDNAAVNECREDNNVCIVTVESTGIGLEPPLPVAGDPVRGRDHGDPNAPMATAVFDWSLDTNGPRDLGLDPGQQHFHVLRGTDPEGLLQIPGTEPFLDTEYLDSTPRAESLPLVHYYKVVAFDSCEQIEQER